MILSDNGIDLSVITVYYMPQTVGYSLMGKVAFDSSGSAYLASAGYYESSTYYSLSYV